MNYWVIFQAGVNKIKTKTKIPIRTEFISELYGRESFLRNCSYWLWSEQIRKDSCINFLLPEILPYPFEGRQYSVVGFSQIISHWVTGKCLCSTCIWIKGLVIQTKSLALQMQLFLNYRCTMFCKKIVL